MISQTFSVFNIIIKRLFIFLLLSLQITFFTNNILLFYFFFEWSLIPIFLIIIGWGYQPERLSASLSLFFYTIFASLPLLIIIFKIFFNRFSFIIPLFCNLKIFFLENNLYIFFIILAFLVKFPIFFVHIWLPKAHVEAPVSGSIVLAGVLLKLGGYGLYRLFMCLDRRGVRILILTISLIGGGILRVLCLSQRDIKVVIAYSSVVHIALVVAGFLSLYKLGVEGRIIIIVAHGLCSSGIFAGANIIYERTHSRRFFLNRGFLVTRPRFRIFWFILIIANFGGPFTYNLLGEILLIINLRYIIKSLILVLCLLSFFSAAYRLILYRSTQQGQISNFNQQFLRFSLREIILLLSHIWPLLFLAIRASLL